MRRTHVVTLRLLAATALALTGGWAAVASAAGALPPCPLPQLADTSGAGADAAVGRTCPTPPPPPTTRPRPTTTTTAPPTAPLRHRYVGTISGDNATQAQLVMTFWGDSGAVFADVDIADGLVLACHGDQAVGPIQARLTGSRSGASVALQTDVAGSVAGFDVHLQLTGSGSLTGDSADLGGPIHVHLGLPWFLGDCDSNWSFQVHAQSAEPSPGLVTVPNVTGLPVTAGLTAIRAAGLTPGVQSTAVQNDCGDGVGAIVATHPSGGSALPPGSPVAYTVGVRPAPPHVCP